MVAAIAATLLLQQFSSPILLGPDNALTPEEKAAGWKLLFDGKTTSGWHNYRAKGVGAGWKVEEGVLTSADPATAGDIVTDEKFEWFELKVDFRLTKGGNSGIMLRATEDAERVWHTAPEVQIYDAPADAVRPQKTGFLYQLYESQVDASRPAGDWNTFRIVIAPEKCQVELNGVKYYEFVWGSDDFWARVKKSKFAEFPGFAKAKEGSIGIQGDHGVVSFKNIKIRPIPARSVAATGDRRG